MLFPCLLIKDYVRGGTYSGVPNEGRAKYHNRRRREAAIDDGVPARNHLRKVIRPTPRMLQRERARKRIGAIVCAG